MSDTAAVVGDTAWLHSTTADFKISVASAGAAHHGVERLAESAAIVALLETRAFARLVGPLRVSVLGPAAADTATTSAAVVTSAALPVWATAATTLAAIGTPAQVLMAVKSVQFVSSLYLRHQEVALEFPASINRQLKPTPLVGRPPAVAYAWSIENGAAASVATITIEGTLELAGQDYISPW